MRPCRNKQLLAS